MEQIEMKTLGILLLGIGCLWALVAFNADTTVETESQFIGSTYIPSQKVNNIGKMDERRNHLILSALAIVVGVILFSVGKVKEPSAPSHLDTNVGNRKCPFCAEFVKAEAVICRFCQKELPPIADPSMAQEVAPPNDEQLMTEFAVTFDGERYCYESYRYDKLADAIRYAKSQTTQRG
jgi:hypothetical protein